MIGNFFINLGGELVVKKAATVGKLYRKRRLIVSITAILGILSALIIILTIYGQNVGSFSIQLDDTLTSRQIFISTDKEFDWYDSRLEAEPVSKASPISLKFIDTELCQNTEGDYVGINRGYTSYTFYIKNMGEEAVDIEEVIRIHGETNNMSDVTWLWHLDDLDTDGTVYKKLDKAESNSPYLNDYPPTTAFSGEKIIANRTITELKPGDSRKITLILWIESQDPDLSNQNDGGAISVSVSFTIKRQEQ